MKYVFAIVLSCIASPLAAGEYCAKNHASRTEYARPQNPPSAPKRVQIVRTPPAKPMLAWHRVLLLEPQIL